MSHQNQNNNPVFGTSKYSAWYFSIINNAKCRGFATKSSAKKALGYVEVHHITPKSLGGTNAIENLAFLTAREHFVCHLLLAKIFEGTVHSHKMIFALNKMLQSSKNQERSTVKSHQYESIRTKFADSISKIRTGVRRGPLTSDHKKKLSVATKGVPKSPEAKQNIRKGRAKQVAQWRANGGHPSKGKKTGPRPNTRKPKVKNVCRISDRKEMCIASFARYLVGYKKSTKENNR